MTTFAVIIGIEQYEIKDWAVKAPAANAIAVAKWALSAGIDPQQIFLFVSKLDEELAAPTGVTVRGTTLRDIDTILRNELRKAEENSTLLFYWSGHGMTDERGQRLFFCSDYSDSSGRPGVQCELVLPKAAQRYV